MIFYAIDPCIFDLTIKLKNMLLFYGEIFKSSFFLG